MAKIVLLSVYYSVFAIAPACWGLSEPFSEPRPALFSSTQILRFRLSAAFSTLVRAKDDPSLNVKRIEVPGELSYTKDDGTAVRAQVQINIKGFASIRMCSFPKLEIKFVRASEITGTLFEGLKTVDLNTHCVEQDDPAADKLAKASGNPHREAFLYRLMNILGMPSFGARPAILQYHDTDSPSVMRAVPGKEYPAFFLEDYGSFRKNHRLKAIRGIHDVNRYMTDPHDAEKLATFVFSSVDESPRVDLEDLFRAVLIQDLAGNTDWFVQLSKDSPRFGKKDADGLWNMKLVETAEGRWLTIPQDFNLSAFVMGYPYYERNMDKSYEGLISREAKIEIFRRFVAKKSELLAATNELSPSDAAAARSYLKKFLSKLESKSRR